MRQRHERESQRLDIAASRLGRPAARMGAQALRLGGMAHRLRYAAMAWGDSQRSSLNGQEQQLARAVRGRLEGATQRVDRLRLRMELLDPRRVLERGYALLTDESGHAVTRAADTRAGQALKATLADGEVALTVTPRP